MLRAGILEEGGREVGGGFGFERKEVEDKML
jgi:hypothetical protein